MKCVNSEVRATTKLVVPAFQRTMFPMSTNEDMSTEHVTVEATASVTRKAALPVTSAIVKLENKKTVLQITNPEDHTYAINPGAVLALFTVVTSNQAKNVKPTPLDPLRLISQFLGTVPHVIDQLIHEPTINENN